MKFICCGNLEYVNVDHISIIQSNCEFFSHPDWEENPEFEEIEITRYDIYCLVPDYDFEIPIVSVCLFSCDIYVEVLLIEYIENSKKTVIEYTEMDNIFNKWKIPADLKDRLKH